MKKLIRKVEKWMVDRNLHTQNPKIQLSKTIEELGELANALNKEKYDLAEDAIGDIQVTLIGICCQLKNMGYDVDYRKSLEFAYKTIENRKGKLVDGIFIKK